MAPHPRPWTSSPYTQLFLNRIRPTLSRVPLAGAPESESATAQTHLLQCGMALIQWSCWIEGVVELGASVPKDDDLAVLAWCRDQVEQWTRHLTLSTLSIGIHSE